MQKNHPDEKVIHEQRVQISEEGFYAVKANHEILRPYFVEPKDDEPIPVPLELIGGKELGVFQDNCGHWVNSEHKRAKLEGTYLYYYTEQAVKDAPGWIHKGIGIFQDKKQFISGDKERTVVTDLSLEDFAAEQNLPLSRIKKKELVKLPEPDGLMLQPEEKNAYVIEPNPELVASAASEEVLTPIRHDDEESMEKLSVALDQMILVMEGTKLNKSYGWKCTGKIEDNIILNYDADKRKYRYNQKTSGSERQAVLYTPNMYEAIAGITEGRYTAQDLIDLQRSNFQAITATYQGSMLASDTDKKPAFDQNSTPSTASDSEEEQQHSVQLGPAPVDPEYEDYLIGSKAMMASFPFLLQQIEERSGLYSYEVWKKAHDVGMEIEKTSKVKSIIEAALKAFKEKFEAIRDKFTKKLKDDIEKTAKDASDSQENGQAEYDAGAQAIHQQKAQEINAMRDQLQESYNSQIAAIAQSKKGECDAFFQQGQAECEAVFAARSAAASNQTSSSGLALSISVSNSDVVAQKNAEVTAFNAQKSAEVEAEQQAMHAQIQSQLGSYIASKESEAEQKCTALKSSIEQRLKSTQESKIKEIAESATNKEKAQVAECNRKIKDIQEDTGLIERLKEAVGNSGDAEAVINEELNVVLQGAASDFGVDAVNL